MDTSVHVSQQHPPVRKRRRRSSAVTLFRSNDMVCKLCTPFVLRVGVVLWMMLTSYCAHCAHCLQSQGNCVEPVSPCPSIVCGIEPSMSGKKPLHSPSCMSTSTSAGFAFGHIIA
jgi:hypothetical protein